MGSLVPNCAGLISKALVYAPAPGSVAFTEPGVAHFISRPALSSTPRELRRVKPGEGGCRDTEVSAAYWLSQGQVRGEAGVKDDAMNPETSNAPVIRNGRTTFRSHIDEGAEDDDLRDHRDNRERI
jgi:hypothetical protein